MTRMGEWARAGDLVKADGEICEVVSGPWAAGGGRRYDGTSAVPYLWVCPVRESADDLRRVPLCRVRVEKTAEERVAEILAAEGDE